MDRTALGLPASEIESPAFRIDQPSVVEQRAMLIANAAPQGLGCLTACEARPTLLEAREGPRCLWACQRVA